MMTDHPHDLAVTSTLVCACGSTRLAVQSPLSWALVRLGDEIAGRPVSESMPSDVVGVVRCRCCGLRQGWVA